MVQCGDPKSEYRQASFKGVPFLVTAEETSVGRRGDLYEFPHGEVTGWRDMGRAAATFSVDGVLLGRDHHEQAMALKAAAESPGPGILVHPIYGEILVACRQLTLSNEPLDARRMTRVRFDFVEVGGLAFPGIVGGLASFFGVVDGFIDLVRETFMAAWNFTGLLQHARETVRAEYRRIVSGVRHEVNIAAEANAETYDVFIALDRQAIAVGDIRADDALLAIHGGIETIYRTATPEASIAAIRSVIELSKETDSSTRAGEHIEALNALLVRMGLSYYILSVLDLESPSVDDVFAHIDFIVRRLDQEMQIASQACDDAMVTAIKTLRAQTIERLMGLVFDAGGTVRYAYHIDAPDGVPSLVLAHHIYGDSKRAEELERNNAAPIAFAASRRIRLFTE